MNIMIMTNSQPYGNLWFVTRMIILIMHLEYKIEIVFAKFSDLIILFNDDIIDTDKIQINILFI